MGAQKGYSDANTRHEAIKTIDYVSKCVVMSQTIRDDGQVETGDCRLLFPDEPAPHSAVVLPKSTSDIIYVQVSDVPQAECKQLENYNRTDITIDGSGCLDDYNDVVIIYDGFGM